jgi:hypothetical protein
MTAVIQWLVDNSYDVSILIEDNEDPFNHTKRFEFTKCFEEKKDFLSSIGTEIELFQPDLIHITDDNESLHIVRKFVDSIPIIFSIHSASTMQIITNQSDMLLADKVLVSTPDILKLVDERIGAEWYDRPSPRWFKYTGNRQSSTALLLYASYFPKDQRELARQWCKEREIELTILDRDKKVIPFERMPDFYSCFEYFLDFKGYEDHPESLSKAAREAALCGCKIVHDSDINRIIEPHELPRVTEKEFILLYKELVESKSG